MCVCMHVVLSLLMLVGGMCKLGVLGSGCHTCWALVICILQNLLQGQDASAADEGEGESDAEEELEEEELEEDEKKEVEEEEKHEEEEGEEEGTEEYSCIKNLVHAFKNVRIKSRSRSLEVEEEKEKEEDDHCTQTEKEDAAEGPKSVSALFATHCC